MTQTPRDWKKDMDTCNEEQAKEDARIQSRWMGVMGPTIASHWLQEAKVYKQSYEGTLTAWEAEKARADAAEEEARYQKGVTEDYAKGYRLQELRAIAAEDREQRMKEEIEYEIQMLELRGSNGRAQDIRDLLTTLYPDTPAPTTKEANHEA